MARKLIKNTSLRSREVAAAIRAIPNIMRDLIRIPKNLYRRQV
ncbi:hypothetical protein [Rickettsia endosymbiont of Orchestes rusci]